MMFSNAFRMDVDTLAHNDAERLKRYVIGRCQAALTAEELVDDYRKSPGTGSFIVIDRLTNVTVGAGMIRGSLKNQCSSKNYKIEGF